MEWLKNVVNWALALVLVGGGGFLIVRAILDLVNGFGKEKKDVKAILWGIGTGIIGSILFFWGASNVIEFFQGLGNSVPKQ